MSATTLAHKGMEAVQNKDWAGAIPLLDKALESSNSPAWLLARCQAHLQLKNYEAALHDAELAYHVAAERGSGTSRKQMIEAQYRRAVVYFRLGQYANADCCAKWSMLLAEGRPAGEKDGIELNVDEDGNYTVTLEQAVADKLGQPGATNQGATVDSIMGLASQGQSGGGNPRTGFEADWNRAYSWRSQALGALKGLSKDHPGWKVTVAKVPKKPEKTAPKKEEPKPAAAEEKKDKEAPKNEPAPGSVPDEQMKLRVDFYQTAQNVTISLFAKDVKKEDLQVHFSRRKVQVSPVPRAAAPYVKPGDREATSTLILGGEIDPSRSRWSVTPRKVELVLQKAAPGAKWASWGQEKIGAVAEEEEEEEEGNEEKSGGAATPAPQRRPSRRSHPPPPPPPPQPRRQPQPLPTPRAAARAPRTGTSWARTRKTSRRATSTTFSSSSTATRRPSSSAP
ncbi:hypothetical protein VTJ83DRAFT_3836 [Remersonia thermophila]|uniref:CS domain-containing protein n=1 Tax=Remersonia thermophila TaxID=72144 RepID=A0ABR4DFB2_9PEZI